MRSRRGLVLLLLVVLASVCLAAQQEGWQDLNQRVLQLYQEHRYADAIPVAQEALKVAEANFGPADPRLATSLNNLAALYREQHKYAEAEPLLKRALGIREKAVESDPLDVAKSLDSLGGLYREQGRYAEAVPLLQRALSIGEKVLGPEDLYVAHLLNNLGEVYEEQGEYTEAQPVLRRAVRIGEKALGEENPRLAMMLNNLATCYDRQGKYAEAEPLLRRSLSMTEKVLGPEDPVIALPLNNLAMVYLAQGKYTEAETLLRRALSIREKTGGPEDPDVAMSLNNLAEAYQEEGKYAEAEPLFQRALRIQEKILGPEHPSVAVLLHNLANLYSHEGKDNEAEPLYQRVLHIQEKTLGPEHPSLALSLDDLAVLYSNHGKYAQAEPLFQRAQSIFEKTLGPEHARVYLVVINLAGMRFAQQLPHEAQLLYARAFDILFHQFQYQFTYMSEKERLGFLATVSGDFPEYFSFVHQFRGQMPELAGDMYNLLLWEKGFIAGSEAALRRQVAASGDAQALKLFDQLAAKRAQIAALLRQQPKDREAWRKQVEQSEAEANDLERQLVARSAAFAQQKQLERATWQQVRDALQPGEAAVEFARFRFYDGKKWTDTSYYVALVVTPKTRKQPAYVVLGEGKQFEGQGLIEFRQQVQARGMETTAAALPGTKVYELLWARLEPLLAGARRVFLSPDGALNQMPLGLVPTPGGKLLMEQYDLRLVSSTKDLLRPLAPPASNAAVLVGDPAFDLGQEQYRASLQKLATPPSPGPVEAMLAPTDRSRDQGASATLSPLPGTGAEIQAVDKLLEQHGWRATAYTGARALEEAVKGVRGPRVLHLATHGFFYADQQIPSGGASRDEPAGLEDPMLRSGLFFAGADEALAGQAPPGDLDDGVLTAYEAASLDLQGTELVVLSACNTGQGEVRNGEGVFGLHRALEEAGAQAVMMSLWPVPDRETQELMTRFYGKWLAGVEKHEALRQAQLEERAVVKERYGADLPYYWGAFVLVGK